MKCENCKFWNRPYQRCQKHAPKIMFSPAGQHGNDWGDAKADDWCGEFEEKNKPFSPRQLNLGVRSLRTLSKLGVDTEEKFLALKEIDLLGVKNCGIGTTDQIMNEQKLYRNKK